MSQEQQGWVRDHEHSWHLPCRYDSIEICAVKDLDDPDTRVQKYRGLLIIKPYRGVPYTEQIAKYGDREILIKTLEGWMESHDDPSDVMDRLPE